MRVILICFANTCRSPVAESLLREMLINEPSVEICSRGLAGGPGETPELMIQALRAASLQLSSVSGETLQRDEARAADLLLFMERRLLRDAVVNDPVLWPVSFTLKEFARRGFANPPERTHERFSEWVALLHSTRHREELLGVDSLDDVQDPGLTGDEVQFTAMIESLRHDVAKVAPLLSGWSSTTV